MSENISKNIYMINQKIQDFNKVLEEENSFEKICNIIITNANKNIEEEKKYDFTLTSEENTKCYLQKKSVPVGWSNFVNNLLQTQIIDIKNIIHSFVLFIKKNENIYAITGGHGYNVIKQYIMPDFGITILEKTFDKSALVMKSMQDRALVGNLLGTSKIFRNVSNVSIEEDFGKLFRKAVAKIEKKILKEFGIDSDKGCSCFAADGFKLTKTMSFNEINNLIGLIDAKYTNPHKKMNLNNISEVIDENIIQKCKNEICKSISKILSNEESDIDFDFSHKEIFKFMYSDKLHIKRKNKVIENNIDSTISFIELMNLIQTEIDLNEPIWTQLDNLIISSHDIEGKQLTSDTIIKHVHCELSVDNSTYFYLDSKFLQITESFVAKLNESFKESMSPKFKNHFDSIFNKDFNREAIKNSYKGPNKNTPYEHIYNKLYLGNDNTIVLDKVLSKNIEICDILKIIGKTLYLAHVKIDFRASMRDVVEQILVSANQVLSWRSSTIEIKSEIEEYFDNAKKAYTKYNYGFPKRKDTFVDMFKSTDYKIVFCLIFIDSNKTNNFIENINKYRSNIAKFSVINVRKQLFEYHFDFQLIQVKEIRK